LGNLSIVCHSHASTDLDQLQEMCIGIDELLNHRKPRLKLPYLKVRVCRLGGDGDSSPNLLGLRSLQFVSGRGRAGAQPAGKFDLPARRGSNCVLPLIAAVAGKTICNRTNRTHDALVQSCARRPEIGCRQKLRARCRGCRTCLADTRKGGGKIKILVQGALHYSHKHRIVEARPPTLESRRRKLRLRRTDASEIMEWSEICCGLSVVWSHSAARQTSAYRKNDRHCFAYVLTHVRSLRPRLRINV
jgi:hypothetical protein